LVLPEPTSPAPADSAGPDAVATAGFVSIGLGGAALIVGIVSGIVAMGAHSSLADACPDARCPESEQETLDRYELAHPLATVGFVAGGALVATGLTLVLLGWEWTSTKPRRPP
jgi:hypothetical protein